LHFFVENSTIGRYRRNDSPIIGACLIMMIE